MLYCRCEKIYTELLKNIRIFENSFWLKHYSFKDVLFHSGINIF